MKRGTKIAGGLTLILTIWLLWFSNSGYDWLAWKRAPCYPDECYCEAPTFSAIEQPSNTYSNLPFVFVGLFIIFRYQDLLHKPNESDIENESEEEKKEDKEPNGLLMMKKGQGFFRITYGTSVMVMGLGSLFYHGSLTAMGKFTDWFGMFLFASYLVVYNWSRFTENGSVAFFAFRYCFLNLILLGVILTIEAYIRSYIFFALLMIGAFSSWYLSTSQAKKITVQTRYAIYSVLLLGLAFFFWCLDKFQIVCNPQSLIQGHAAWHSLTALATAFVYFYFLSESKKQSSLVHV